MGSTMFFPLPELAVVGGAAESIRHCRRLPRRAAESIRRPRRVHVLHFAREGRQAGSQEGLHSLVRHPARPHRSGRRQGLRQWRRRASGEAYEIGSCVPAIRTAVVASSHVNFQVEPLLNAYKGNQLFFTGTIPFVICYMNKMLLYDFLGLPVLQFKSSTSPANIMIYIDTAIVVLISYVPFLKIKLSYIWLAIFPFMTLVFIGELCHELSRQSGSYIHTSGLIILGAVVAPAFAYLASTMDESAGLLIYHVGTKTLVSCGVSGLLIYYVVFMLRQWPGEFECSPYCPCRCSM